LPACIYYTVQNQLKKKKKVEYLLKYLRPLLVHVEVKGDFAEQVESDSGGQQGLWWLVRGIFGNQVNTSGCQSGCLPIEPEISCF